MKIPCLGNRVSPEAQRGPGGTLARGDGESWEKYAQRLERALAAEQKAVAQLKAAAKCGPKLTRMDSHSKVAQLEGNDVETRQYIMSQFVQGSGAADAPVSQRAPPGLKRAGTVVLAVSRLTGGHENDAEASSSSAQRPLLRKASLVVSKRHLPVGASDEDLATMVRVRAQIDADEWDADVLGLCRVINAPMVFVVGLVLAKYDALAQLQTDSETLDALLTELEAGYRPQNPYHNATHGADVAYTTHCMMKHGCRAALGLSEQQAVVAVLAAAAHDFRHPGIASPYLVATRHDLALTYNDMSVLESMHAAEFFKVLKAEPRADVFARLEPKVRAELRKLIIQMILATDMSVHFSFIDQFNQKFVASPPASAAAIGADDRAFAMSMMLHCADISNPAKPRAHYLDWTDRVLAEFYCQGDREAEAKVPVSTFFDRHSPNVVKCQTGFIKFIVKPIFDAWTSFVPALGAHCMHHVEGNFGMWADGGGVPEPQLFVDAAKADWDWDACRWEARG